MTFLFRFNKSNKCLFVVVVAVVCNVAARRSVTDLGGALSTIQCRMSGVPGLGGKVAVLYISECDIVD